jgi:hypothetical protein
MLTGNVVPVIEKAAPVTLAAEMFSVALPGLETVSDRFAEVLTVMLPKSIVAGEVAICATLPLVAVPLMETTAGEFAAFETNETVPLMLPVEVGVTVIETGKLAPAAIVAGKDKPGAPKVELLAFIAVTVAALPPLLVNVTVCDAVVPTRTEPKSAEAGLAEMLAGLDEPPPPVNEPLLPVLPHPVCRIAASTTATRNAIPR